MTLACGPPPCVPSGSDVSGWKPVEVSPDAKTAPIVECGKTVGFDISMPAGDHASTMWRYEIAAPVKAGEKVAFSVALESFGPPLFSLRPSIESADRSELGFVEHKAVGMVRAVVPDQIAPMDGRLPCSASGVSTVRRGQVARVRFHRLVIRLTRLYRSDSAVALPFTEASHTRSRAASGVKSAVTRKSRIISAKSNGPNFLPGSAEYSETNRLPFFVTVTVTVFMVSLAFFARLAV